MPSGCVSSPDSAASPAARPGRMRLTRAADQRKVAAAIAKATAGSVAASTTPPIAGPAKTVTLSTVLETTFAAVSSAGVEASVGRIAACAGRKAVEAIPDRPASARRKTSGDPVKATTAAAAIRTARTRSAASITRARSKRSPSSAANGAATAGVTSSTKASRPSAAAPPSSKASTDSASE